MLRAWYVACDPLGDMRYLTLLLLAPEAARATAPEGPDLGRYLLVCALLVALIAALGWGFRRLVAGGLARRAAGRSLRVVDVLPLGGRRKLAVVRCYDRTFVLGLGEREISLVAELADDEALSLAPPKAPRESAAEPPGRAPALLRPADFARIVAEARPRAPRPQDGRPGQAGRLGPRGEGIYG